MGGTCIAIHPFQVGVGGASFFIRDQTKSEDDEGDIEDMYENLGKSEMQGSVV